MEHSISASPAHQGADSALPQNQSAQPDGFIDEAQLRQRLPVSKRTLYNWRAAGKLPHLCLPGSRRVLYHWPTVERALLRFQRGEV